MGQALYRKYRSKSLSEIVGQEHITETLQKALEGGRISHAYLFSGPRGVGKTSIARILAHELNGLPYTDDAAHLDIIEIDAASNRRIDEIRDLRDKVYIAPTSGKYKVYIIDEVHMLTREAFNALLKTLEEPPAHAVFILATTESHKLPDTIISRTQHYTFKPVEQNKVVAHLGLIAKEENIDITTEALELLAAHGQGSFRDSISLLDQAGSSGIAVDVHTVRQLLGIAPDQAINELLRTISQKGGAAPIMTTLADLYGQGLQAASLASQLAEKIRGSILSGTPLLGTAEALRLMRELIEVPTSHNPERLLEIVLLNAGSHAIEPVTQTVPAVTQAPAPAYQAAPVAQPSKPAPAPVLTKPLTSTGTPIVIAPPAIAQSAARPSEPAPVEEPNAIVQPIGPAVVRLLDESVWPEVLDGLKKQYNTLYGVLRMAKPVFTSDGIELQMKFAFHQKRLNEVKNKQIVAGFIKQVTGKDCVITCTVMQNPGNTAPAAVAVGAAPAELGAISDIFGGGEVL